MGFVRPRGPARYRGPVVSRRPLALVLGLALFAGSSPAQGQPRNNYYRWVEPDGTIHVTNVPRRTPGAWQLWKSMPGSGGGRSSMSGGRGDESPVALSAERFHRYDSIIRAAAARYQLPQSLLRAVIHTESNYQPHAVSRAGAIGLMQLMPKTARSLGVREPFEPSQNIHGGARYLRLLANRYGGDMVLVLAAYNAGAGNVEKHGGVPPFEETRAYVRSVLRRYYAYERQAREGGEQLRRSPARNLPE